MRLLHTKTKKGGCILYEILVSQERITELYRRGYLDRPHAFYETDLGKRTLRKLSDQERNDLLKSNKLKKSQ